MSETILVRGARQLLTLRGPSVPRRGAALRPGALERLGHEIGHLDGWGQGLYAGMRKEYVVDMLTARDLGTLP